MKKIFYFALSIVISLGACENDNYNCYSDNSLVHFHEERIKDWLAKGAVMTDTVKKIYKMYKKQAVVQ